MHALFLHGMTGPGGAEGWIGALMLLLTCGLLFGATEGQAGLAPAPPAARVEVVTDTLHGMTIDDPYRWMENDQDPDWGRYMRAQGEYARATLDAMPGRAELARRIAELSGEQPAVNAVQSSGGRLFIERRPAGANNFMLFVRDELVGEERLLFDPETRTAGEIHHALNYWVPSPDGKWVALGISASGSESASIEILEVDTGRFLPESIDRCQYAFPAWLPDSRGFFYIRLAPGREPGSVEYYQDIVCWLHRLGTDPSTDVKTLGQEMFPEVPVSSLEAASIAPLQGTEFVIAAVNTGVQPELALYLNTLANASAGKGGWRPICGVEDAVTGFVSRGDEIFLLSHRDAPHFQVLRVTTASPGISSAAVVVPESETILQGLYVGRDALYIHDMKDGVDRLRRRGDDGAVTEVAIPHAGSITMVAADAERDGLLFGLRSWLSSNAIFQLAADGAVRATDLTPPSAFDSDGFASEELLVTARDGVSVPLSIVYRKGIARDGSAPTLITAYGAYGLSVTPNNQTMMAFPLNLAFLERGGIWAISHVRGGGERGLEWHEAGKLRNKHRSWEDLIDCAEYLVAERWTSPARLAVHGRSAGAIPMGRAITERPDLFAVGISNVGVHNSLRGEFTPNGPANTPEFGSNATEEGFLGLRSSDSCAHVRSGVRYPAVLLTTGMTDRRVAPWLVAKFAAHLQAATASGRPVLLRVDFQAGHGVGSTREQRDAELADMFGFVLWQTGVSP